MIFYRSKLTMTFCTVINYSSLSLIKVYQSIKFFFLTAIFTLKGADKIRAFILR